MKLIILIFICSLTVSASSFNGDSASAEDFLQNMRKPRAVQTWAKMDGTAEHLRRGSSKISVPIYLGIMFAADRILSQIIIDQQQGYLVGQTFSGKDSGTSIIPIHSDRSGGERLAEIGLRPEDLAMSFIYWDFVRELPRESISMRECRVFILKKDQELVKLSADVNYYFPLKVEWYKNEYSNDAKSYRTLEAVRFKEVNHLWLVTRLLVSGPGWRTSIDFAKADAGINNNETPADIFKKL
ncbi:MAG: hypothetical protein PHO45_00655 [Victivallaceae bacterium]|nr:hypothetical protein [Victivallaceae bacterium]